METALWPIIEHKYVRYSEIKLVMEFSSIEQSAVIGPVHLTIDPSHGLLRMEVQANTQTST